MHKQVVLCLQSTGLQLAAQPFGKVVATVMRGGSTGLTPIRSPRPKEKKKYSDAKHILRKGFTNLC